MLFIVEGNGGKHFWLTYYYKKVELINLYYGRWQYNALGGADRFDRVFRILLRLRDRIFFLNQIRLKSRAEEGDTSAARVLAMAEKYDKLLSSILIGNNIVNIAAASIGTVLFTKWLGAERGATTSTIVLTVVVLIFGEVTPKTLAKEMPETIATAVSPVLSLLLTLFTP